MTKANRAKPNTLDQKVIHSAAHLTGLLVVGPTCLDKAVVSIFDDKARRLIQKVCLNLILTAKVAGAMLRLATMTERRSLAWLPQLLKQSGSSQAILAAW